MIVKSRYKFTPTCDCCGKQLQAEYDYWDAAASMRREGWAFVRPDTASGEWYNFCPVCKGGRKKDG